MWCFVGHSLGARVVLQAVADGTPAAGMLLIDLPRLIRPHVTPRMMHGAHRLDEGERDAT